MLEHLRVGTYPGPSDTWIGRIVISYPISPALVMHIGCIGRRVPCGLGLWERGMTDDRSKMDVIPDDWT